MAKSPTSLPSSSYPPCYLMGPGQLYWVGILRVSYRIFEKHFYADTYADYLLKGARLTTAELLPPEHVFDPEVEKGQIRPAAQYSRNCNKSIHHQKRQMQQFAGLFETILWAVTSASMHYVVLRRTSAAGKNCSCPKLFPLHLLL